ncbi:MAG: hypothetical protein ACXV45_09050 [Halobacteriota archaeon]
MTTVPASTANAKSMNFFSLYLPSTQIGVLHGSCSAFIRALKGFLRAFLIIEGSGHVFEQL